MPRTTAVVVASSPKLDRKKELATYRCGDCKNGTVVQASMEAPFCTHCGSDNLKPRENASAKGSVLLETKEEELASVKCSGCSAFTIMPQTTALAHADGDVGHINCAACGTEIAYEAEDLDPDADVLDDEEEEQEEEEQASEIPDELEQDLDDLEGKEEESSEQEESEEEEEASLGETVPMSLCRCCQGPPGFMRGQNAQGQPVIFATKGETVVGMKVCSSDSENSDNYLKALETAAASGDFETVLTGNGFTLSSVDVPVSDLMENEISKRVCAVEEQLNTEKSRIRDVLGQSLSLAATGLSRGFFNDKDNPLKSNLSTSLATAVGIDEEVANAIVEEALIECSDDYSATLLDVASDISGKSDDVRNELAKTIMGSRAVKTTSTASVVALRDSVSNRLTQAIKPATTKKPDHETASTQKPDTRVKELAAKSPLFGRR